MNKLVKHHPRSSLAGALSVALLFIAGGALAQEAAMEEEELAQTEQQMESDQPVSDTWITTKVKSGLLADTDVAGLDIQVETVNGMVSLSGHADSQAQIDRAVEIANRIEGVASVDASALSTHSGSDHDD